MPSTTMQQSLKRASGALILSLILAPAVMAQEAGSEMTIKDSKASEERAIWPAGNNVLPPVLAVSKTTPNANVAAGGTIPYTISITNFGTGTQDGEATDLAVSLSDIIPASLSNVSCEVSYYDASQTLVLQTFDDSHLYGCVDSGDFLTPRSPYVCDTPGQGVNGGPLAAGGIACGLDISGLQNGIINTVDFETNFFPLGTSWDTEFRFFVDTTPVDRAFGINFGGYGAGAPSATIVNGVTTGATANQGSHTATTCAPAPFPATDWQVYIFEGFNDAGENPDSCLQDFTFTVNGHPYVTTTINGNNFNLSDIAVASDGDNCALSPTVVTCQGQPDWTALCAAGLPVNFNNTVTMTDGTAAVTTSEAQVAFDGVAGCAAFPVELASFEALNDQDRSVLLTWKTLSELNNSGFKVEHHLGSHTNAFVEWEELNFVQGFGTTTETNYYEYRVEDLTPGVHSFRLNQLDFDGEQSYSSIIEVEIDIPGTHVLTSAYPNPFNPSTSFEFGVAENVEVEVGLFDLNGKSIQSLFTGEALANTMYAVELDASALVSGIYIIQLKGPNFTETQKVTLLK